MKSVINTFNLKGRVALITGGAGLLGPKHAEALLQAGATVLLLDVNSQALKKTVAALRRRYGKAIEGLRVDITSEKSLTNAKRAILRRWKRIDILINNAAVDPKVLPGRGNPVSSRFENLPLKQWNSELAVGLTGSFLCSQIFGSYMASQKRGVILNIASDLAVISPDQRLYRVPGLPEEAQPAKPVTYSVVKTGLLGLTRYLATYWALNHVRVNALCPGGIFNGQDERFVQRLSSLIPMGRMAKADEYQAAILFLVSDASSYMTGSHIVMDGGRTIW